MLWRFQNFLKALSKAFEGVFKLDIKLKNTLLRRLRSKDTVPMPLDYKKKAYLV